MWDTNDPIAELRAKAREMFPYDESLMRATYHWHAADEIERLRAIEKAARTYYHNYCQDEANEEGICGLAQQLDAIALRDALAVDPSTST